MLIDSKSKLQDAFPAMIVKSVIKLGLSVITLLQ